MFVRTLPSVTFVIPTLDASYVLPKCLYSIRNQDYPGEKIEIIVADGGSTDDTVNIAKSFGAKVIRNPEVLHEPGKSRASRLASGEIIFYTDADNVLATRKWIRLMVRPYIENRGVTGFLPQTEPPPDSTGLNRYLGYLFTDPFTWFVYGPAANPKYYGLRFRPVKKSSAYTLYRFTPDDAPLFGLSQGVGTSKAFARTGTSRTDDITAGLNLIKAGSLVAYVPEAGVYHYHVAGLRSYIRKYSLRIRGNFLHTVKGMGILNRISAFPRMRKIRMLLFVPYALTILFPILDSIRLSIRERDVVMLWHIPATYILGWIIIWETARFYAKKSLSEKTQVP